MLYYIVLKQRRDEVILISISSQNKDNYFDKFAATRLRYHKNSGESFRNEMKSAEGVSRKQICKSLRQKDGGMNYGNFWTY